MDEEQIFRQEIINVELLLDVNGVKYTHHVKAFLHHDITLEDISKAVDSVANECKYHYRYTLDKIKYGENR